MRPEEPEDRFVGAARVPSRAVDPVTAVPAPAARPPRPNRALWFAGAGAVAVIVLSIGVLVGYALRPAPVASPGAAAKTSASPKPPPRDSPKTVTQRYLDAVVAGDKTKSDKELCGLLRGTPQNQADLSQYHVNDLVTLEAQEGKVDGKRATVEVKVAVPILGSTRFTVDLVDEKGVWKVCGFGAGQ
ncbi:hypothetical protein HDA40_001267 [Hamadaea flava]|uniref:DUF4878 domain-containing protein n=1 Tax=Hamadaea flava TaxID=1742688 RepID=A0ABV8LQN7_9ACTN|nr:hypothetical protein [Hamadaea flava]MCP2322760.1 hypothetical protein [Hamadaea flava]